MLLDPARGWGWRSKILLLLGCGCLLLLLWPWDKVSGDTPGSLSNPQSSLQGYLTALELSSSFFHAWGGLASPTLGLEQEMPVCWGVWALQDGREETSMSKWKGMGKEEPQFQFFPPNPAPHNNLFLVVFFLRAATSSLPLPSLLCRIPED